MLNLSDMNEIAVIMREKGSLIIDGEKYFYKRCSNRLMELVTQRLAEMVDLHTAHYEIVMVKGDKYYFSKDLGAEGDYKSAFDLFGEVDTIPDIMRKLRSDEPELADYLGFEVVKMYLFDLIVMNYDRNSSNWGIRFGKQSVDLCLLDNDLSFSLPMCTISAKNKLPYKLRQYEDEGLINNNYRDLQYFLENYYEGYIELFYKMYGLFTPELVAKTMELVEKENRMTIEEKDRILRDYQSHYDSLTYFINLHKGTQKKNAD